MKKQTMTILIMLSLISLTLAHTGNDEFDHCSGFCSMMGGDYGISGMIFGWFVYLLVIIVIILFIVWLIKQIQRR